MLIHQSIALARQGGHIRSSFTKVGGVIVSIGVLILWAGCGGGGEGGGQSTTSVLGEQMSAGAVTTSAGGVEAFEQVAPNADAATRAAFERGNSFFESAWVTAPSSTVVRDGRGPLSNANSCDQCHVHDGRGMPDPAAGLLIRLSSPVTAIAHRSSSTRRSLLALTGWSLATARVADPVLGPLPGYGGQFQPFGLVGGTAIDAIPGEGTVVITYVEEPGTYGDGETYTLRRPSYQLTNLAYGVLPEGTLLSPRVAPPVIGDGLLEAIPESRLSALADEFDQNGDGISGRLNHVLDIRSGATRIGRFGWKAGNPSIEQQSAGAFLGDIGITTSLFPADDLTTAQVAVIAPATLTARSGGAPELSDALLADVVTYIRTLAVPVRRNWTAPDVVRGKLNFTAFGCASCHVVEHLTGAATIAALAHQTIRPYTDLLLHDMGVDLADDRPEFEATGSEWRTPPLWGLGLTQVVSGHTFLLHDGRARGVAEAILWHGGEAQAAREHFRMAAARTRQDLLAFLASL